ncbi:Uncharacterized protein TCM_023649 [Theobroma cacao]|uniref:Uncharacterized protein n=1 Tax=Theobroma cacao TaxID=3641 RepID=A0A061EVM0_THECC|nr:Uncharacterized protein TCM_023649 [Theobroma cacao]
MSRRGGSLDTSHSDSEGSLDSTARSKWHPDTGDSEGGLSRISDNRIPKSLSEWVHNKGSFKSSENFESESSSNTPKIEQDFLRNNLESTLENGRGKKLQGDIFILGRA